MNGGLKWVINVVTKLPTYVDGRVALVGDAVGPFQVDYPGLCQQNALFLRLTRWAITWVQVLDKALKYAVRHAMHRIRVLRIPYVGRVHSGQAYQPYWCDQEGPAGRPKDLRRDQAPLHSKRCCACS